MSIPPSESFLHPSHSSIRVHPSHFSIRVIWGSASHDPNRAHLEPGRGGRRSETFESHPSRSDPAKHPSRILVASPLGSGSARNRHRFDKVQFRYRLEKARSFDLGSDRALRDARAHPSPLACGTRQRSGRAGLRSGRDSDRFGLEHGVLCR
jgi:hypothetical protein